MKTLFLDLASHDGLLACIEGDAVAADVAIDRRIADHELMPIFDGALRDAGWKLSDIERIACVTGPGGFTSLRVAVSFVNALAWTLSVPAAAIHLSDLLRATTQEDDLLWLHSTKREQLFCRGFGKHAQAWLEPECLTLSRFEEACPAGASWIGELIPDHRAIADRLSFKEAKRRPTADVLPALVDELRYGREILRPWYGRGW